MTNWEFEKILEQLEKKIDTAQNAEELLQTIDIVKSKEGPLRYNNTFLYSLAFVIFVIAMNFSMLVEMQNGGDKFFFALVMFCSAIFIAMYAWVRTDTLMELSMKAYLKDALWDNHVEDEASSLEGLQQKFSIFCAGDKGQEIKSWRVFRDRPEIRYFHFHYIQNKTDLSSFTIPTLGVPYGTPEEKHDLYGVIIPFASDLHGLIVRTNNIARFPKLALPPQTLSDERYEQRLDAYCENAESISTFAKPDVLSFIKRYIQNKQRFYLEVREREICIAISEPIVETPTLKHGYFYPDMFEEKLRGKTEFKTFDDLKALVELLNAHFSKS